MPFISDTEFPADIHRELRLEAVRRGVSLKQTIRDVLREAASKFEHSKLAAPGAGGAVLGTTPAKSAGQSPTAGDSVAGLRIREAGTGK